VLQLTFIFQLSYYIASVLDITGDGEDFIRRSRRSSGIHRCMWLCCWIIKNVCWESSAVWKL